MPLKQLGEKKQKDPKSKHEKIKKNFFPIKRLYKNEILLI
jgi:hypothetical protein